MEGDWYISKDIYIGKNRSNNSNSKIGESGKDNPNSN